MPHWSSRLRAQRAANIWGNEVRPVSFSLNTWRNIALAGLAVEDCRIGINWTGPRLVGWDFTVSEVLNR
jgi:hypothetical protein